MRKTLVISAIAFLMAFTPLLKCQDDSSSGFFSPEQLDNLLAPIALYPDPLLAQVLLAATFPDQIDEAARFLRANSDPNSIDSEPWDVSVKSVAHYPTVLYMMADKLDWTTSVGQAYASQSTDVTDSVQRLRAQARSAGNLISTPQQEIRETGGYIQIWPAQPQFIYVPIYDPGIVYYGRGGFFGGSAISFGGGFAIGAWLNRDFDWRGRRVLYNGWDYGGGWVGRSRPFVRVSNVYVNNNFRNVAINRSVMNRTVNYNNLNRYNGVHREGNFNNVRVNRTVVRNQTFVNNNRAVVNNKIIQRNINTNDSRIDAYRGRGEAPRQQVRPEPNRPAFQPQRQERAESPAFGGNRGGFGARVESQRGQASRTEMSRPAPSRTETSRPAPASKSSNQPQSHDRGGRQR
ncbi:MAG: DUF3300 domain-containing protein [Bryobacteraceae bacterium]|jgi:hypothetical protein